GLLRFRFVLGLFLVRFRLVVVERLVVLVVAGVLVVELQLVAVGRDRLGPALGEEILLATGHVGRGHLVDRAVRAQRVADALGQRDLDGIDAYRRPQLVGASRAYGLGLGLGLGIPAGGLTGHEDLRCRSCYSVGPP